MSQHNPSAGPSTRRAVKDRQRAGSRTRQARVAVVACAAGIGLVGAFLAVQAMNPALVEEIAGQIKVSSLSAPAVEIAGQPGDAPAVPGPRPAAVVLGAAGGEPELARCDNTFTRMVAYGEAVQPVWAAHNDCGGDVMLPWEIGQTITVTANGVTSAYRVVDARDTPKEGATTDDIAGMAGDLLLQTCYYGVDRMKFLGLTLDR